MTNQFVSLGVYGLVAAALVVMVSIGIENLINSLDSMLVPCQHGTEIGADGTCSCVDTPFEGQYCGTCKCKHGSCVFGPGTTPSISDYGCRCLLDTKWFGLLCDTCNTVDNDTCTGDCKDGFSGDRCQNVCFPHLHYDDTTAADVTGDAATCRDLRLAGGNCDVCSGHGTCNSGQCECDENYFDDGLYSCSKTCPSDERGVCSGHGACKLFGGVPSCLCTSGWRGLKCDVMCPGVDINDRSCSGHGQCTVDFEQTPPTASCNCNQKYRGVGCEHECPGVTACTDNGVCDSSGVCTCFDDWVGPACDCSSSISCNNRGQCNADGQCECEGNFAGINCLRCKRNYWGSECQFYCDPNAESNATHLGCHGKGQCVVLGMDQSSESVECVCNVPSKTVFSNGAQNTYRSFYSKEENCANCEANYIPLVNVSDTIMECSILVMDTTCNKLGTANEKYGLDGESLCDCFNPHMDDASFCTQCEEHWFPTLENNGAAACRNFCSNDLVSFPPECESGDIQCITCSGNGVCGPDGQCICDSGFIGKECEIQCEVDALGRVCSGNGECVASHMQPLLEYELPYLNASGSLYTCECNPQDPYTAEERSEFLTAVENNRAIGSLDPPPTKNFYGDQCTFTCNSPPWLNSEKCNGNTCKIASIQTTSGTTFSCTSDTDCHENSNVFNILSADTNYETNQGPFCHKAEKPCVDSVFTNDNCLEILTLEKPPAARSKECLNSTGCRNYLNTVNWDDYCTTVLSKKDLGSTCAGFNDILQVGCQTTVPATCVHTINVSTSASDENVIDKLNYCYEYDKRHYPFSISPTFRWKEGVALHDEIEPALAEYKLKHPQAHFHVGTFCPAYLKRYSLDIAEVHTNSRHLCNNIVQDNTECLVTLEDYPTYKPFKVVCPTYETLHTSLVDAILSRPNFCTIEEIEPRYLFTNQSLGNVCALDAHCSSGHCSENNVCCSIHCERCGVDGVCLDTYKNEFFVGNLGSAAWEVDGEPSPTLRLRPGRAYTFHRTTEGHTLRIVRAEDCSGCENGIYNTLPTSALSDVSLNTPLTWTPTSGIYYYVCTLHPQMVGSIEVKDEDVSCPLGQFSDGYSCHDMPISLLETVCGERDYSYCKTNNPVNVYEKHLQGSLWFDGDGVFSFYVESNSIVKMSDVLLFRHDEEELFRIFLYQGQIQLNNVTTLQSCEVTNPTCLDDFRYEANAKVKISLQVDFVEQVVILTRDDVSKQSDFFVKGISFPSSINNVQIQAKSATTVYSHFLFHRTDNQKLDECIDVMAFLQYPLLLEPQLNIVDVCEDLQVDFSAATNVDASIKDLDWSTYCNFTAQFSEAHACTSDYTMLEDVDTCFPFIPEESTKQCALDSLNFDWPGQCTEIEHAYVLDAMRQHCPAKCYKQFIGYDQCDTRKAVFDGNQINVSISNCDIDWIDHCHKVATNQHTGVCAGAECDCDRSKSLTGSSCELYCPSSSDGSPCGEDSGLGFCSMPSNIQLPYSTQKVEIIGECKCALSEGSSSGNCDVPCSSCANTTYLSSYSRSVCDSSRGLCVCLPPFVRLTEEDSSRFDGVRRMTLVQQYEVPSELSRTEQYRVRAMQGPQAFVQQFLGQANWEEAYISFQSNPQQFDCASYQVKTSSDVNSKSIDHIDCSRIEGYAGIHTKESPYGCFRYNGDILFNPNGTQACSTEYECFEIASCNQHDVIMLANLKETSYLFNHDCKKECPGTDNTTYLPCSGHGRCGINGECICDVAKVVKGTSAEGYRFDIHVRDGDSLTSDTYLISKLDSTGYRGPACSIQCPGFDSNTGDMRGVCSGHGVCNMDGECQCDLGYTGENCEFQCPTSENENVCSGHGNCILTEIDLAKRLLDSYTISDVTGVQNTFSVSQDDCKDACSSMRYVKNSFDFPRGCSVIPTQGFLSCIYNDFTLKQGYEWFQQTLDRSLSNYSEVSLQTTSVNECLSFCREEGFTVASHTTECLCQNSELGIVSAVNGALYFLKPIVLQPANCTGNCVVYNTEGATGVTYSEVDLEYTFIRSGANENGLTERECGEYANLYQMPLTAAECQSIAFTFPPTKIVDGECSGTNDVLKFEGSVDNPGSLHDKVTRCKDACSGADGFKLNSDGKCYCEYEDTSECTITNATGFQRYNFNAWAGLNFAERPFGCSLQAGVITYHTTGEGTCQTTPTVECVPRILKQNYSNRYPSGCSQDRDTNVVHYNTNANVDCWEKYSLENGVSNLDESQCLLAARNMDLPMQTLSLSNMNERLHYPHGCYFQAGNVIFNNFFNEHPALIYTKVSCETASNDVFISGTFQCFQTSGDGMCVQKLKFRKEADEYLGVQRPVAQAMFDAACDIDGLFHDYRTGKCVKRDAMLKVPLTLGDPVLIETTVDCMLKENNSLICSQCNCFEDEQYGFWGSLSCETCLSGYGGEQCKDRCPTYDGIDIASSCSGESICNWGSQKIGRERVFGDATCMCGDVSFDRGRTEMYKYDRSYTLQYASTSLTYDTIACSSEAEIEISRYDRCYHYNISDASCGTCEMGWTGKHCQWKCDKCLGGGRCSMRPSEQESGDCDCSLNSAISGLLWGRNCCPINFIVTVTDLLDNIAQEDPVESGPFEVVYGPNMNTVSYEVCKNYRLQDVDRSSRGIVRGSFSTAPYGCYVDVTRNYYFNDATTTVDCSAIQVCISNSFFSLDDIIIKPYEASNYVSDSGGLVDQIGMASNDAAKYCQRCPGTKNSDWLTGNSQAPCGGSSTRGRCVIKNQGEAKCKCLTEWRGPFCRCSPTVALAFQNEYTDYGCTSIADENGEGGGIVGTCLDEAIIVNGAPVYCGPPRGFYVRVDEQGSSTVAASRGYFILDTGSIAVTQTPCPVGTYQPDFGQWECLKCTTGQYQDEIGQEDCKTCAVGTVQPNEAQSTCIDCLPGSYSPVQAQVSCQTCLPGTYQNEHAQPDCKDCVAGAKCPFPSMTAFIHCAAGSFQNEQGRTNCKECAEGRFSNSPGSPIVVCTECSTGTYQNERGKIACKNCLPGFFQDETGQVNGCTSCVAGTYSAAAASVCIGCPAGKYASGTDASSCESCPWGQHALGTGNTACTVCPLGKVYGLRSTSYGWASHGSAAGCVDCPAGTAAIDKDYYSINRRILDPDFVPVARNKHCSYCSFGQYQNQQGQTSCKRCAYGKYSFGAVPQSSCRGSTCSAYIGETAWSSGCSYQQCATLGTRDGGSCAGYDGAGYSGTAYGTCTDYWTAKNYKTCATWGCGSGQVPCAYGCCHSSGVVCGIYGFFCNPYSCIFGTCYEWCLSCSGCALTYGQPTTGTYPLTCEHPNCGANEIYFWAACKY